MKSPRGILSLTVLLAATALSACSASVSVGENTIDADELGEQVAAQLHENYPDLPAPIIDCPEDLKAKVDAVAHCTLSTDDSDEEYDVRVTVTKVNEDTERADFDIQVADEPNE